MNNKRKASAAFSPDFIARVVDTVKISILATLATLLGTIVVMTVLQSSSHESPYRFCLAAVTDDSCVMRPGIIIGDKIMKSPDKLLEYFGSIPERVHNEWRVWVMDKEKLSTVELTVEEFYVWIDTVWHPLLAEANTS